MKKDNRRDFLKKTSAVAPILLLAHNSIIGKDKIDEDVFETSYNFVMQPGVFVNLDKNYNSQSITPWAINTKDQDLIPYLLGEKTITEQSSKKSRIESNSDKNGNSQDIIQRLADFQFLGQLPMAELISEIGTARYEGKSLTINFEAFDQINKKEGSPKIGMAGDLLTLESDLISEYIRWWINGIGYKLQFRGPDLEGLSGCAPEAPKHYSLELFKSAGNGRYDYVANYHIAIWRANGRICFALANNLGSPQCFKVCSPSYNDIRSPIQQALRSNGVNSAIAAALAATVATLIFGSIFVLAV